MLMYTEVISDLTQKDWTRIESEPSPTECIYPYGIY